MMKKKKKKKKKYVVQTYPQRVFKIGHENKAEISFDFGVGRKSLHWNARLTELIFHPVESQTQKQLVSIVMYYAAIH